MILYLDLEDVKNIHDDVINKFGGKSGIINEGLILSALELIKNDDYYPLLLDKTTHLLFSITKNHSFNDGNKRTALASILSFLMLNDISDTQLNNIAIELKNTTESVASSKISKLQLKTILSKYIKI